MDVKNNSLDGLPSNVKGINSQCNGSGNTDGICPRILGINENVLSIAIDEDCSESSLPE